MVYRTETKSDYFFSRSMIFTSFTYIIWILVLFLAVANGKTKPTTTVSTTPAPTEYTGGLSKGGFSIITSSATKKIRTTPAPISVKDYCDYIAYYCIRTYRTGKICGRTVYLKYRTFTNYCLLDYINCMERYDLWQIAHMGECLDLDFMGVYTNYVYDQDIFLDDYYTLGTVTY